MRILYRGGMFVKQIFKSVWFKILSALFFMGFALNFVLSFFVLASFGFTLTAKITSFSLLFLSSLIIFFIILFSYLVATKRIKNN